MRRTSSKGDKKMKKLFKKTCSFFIGMFICIVWIAAIPAPAKDTDGNMLVNPDWEDGMAGWQTVEDEPEQMPERIFNGYIWGKLRNIKNFPQI